MSQGYRLDAFVDDDTGRRQFHLEISAPIMGESGEDYYCTIHAPLLFTAEKRIYGVDGEQAVFLAYQFIRGILSDWRLLDNDGQPIKL